MELIHKLRRKEESLHSYAVIKLDNNIKDLDRAPFVDTAGDLTELNQLIPTYRIPWKRKEERYDLIQKLEPGLEEVELLVTLEKTKSLTKGMPTLKLLTYLPILIDDVLRDIDMTSLADEIEIADERRLYKKAMTKGYVEISVTKCLIIGAAGVGKTHLKRLLLKKDPPEQRVSTGLADNPRRTISFSLAGVGGQEEDDWFVVENDQALLKVIGGFVTSGSMLKEISMDEVVRMLPKMPINAPSDGAGADPTPARLRVTMDTTQQSRAAAIEEEMIHHINHPSGKEKLFGVKWIHFIDSGGQLQYHDILPLFIQNPGVTVFVLNLSEELSHKPMIEYYGADGKPVAGAYRSSLSHEQILQHCLEAICSQNARPLIITVGTHRDAADKCSESIKEKNQHLKTLLNSDSFAVLYNGQALKEAIFPVNGKAPQDEDIRVANVLREEIVSMSPESIKMPIAWLGLEVLLKKSSCDGILSIVECQVCAKSLYIEGDAFSAALHHLVHHNVFLHYPEVLPQTVFCDPQVVLTKVTELVEYHHKLQHDPDEGVAARSDLVRFRDHGLLSVKLLTTFPKHFKESLFTPHDLLQLLLRIGVIAKIRDSEYLMPALLSYLDSDKVVKYVHCTSLIVKPTQGCIPSGLFCCLVAHLLTQTSPSPWKLCMDGDKPLCLYRNCITFELENRVEIVTLVDMFSYVVVHLNEISSEVCTEIKMSVHSAIKNACRVLKYQCIQFKDAFMCAGTSCDSDPSHVATVVSEKKWKCSIRGHQNGDLSEDQLMWLGESGVTNQEASITGMPTLRLLSSLPILIDGVKKNLNIIQRTMKSYTKLGMLLLVDDNCDIVDSLEEKYHRDPEKIVTAVYKKWISGTGRKPVTWKTLVDVLRDIELNSLAEEIEALLNCKANRSD